MLSLHFHSTFILTFTVCPFNKYGVGCGTCKVNYNGSNCIDCASGYFGYPECNGNIHCFEIPLHSNLAL